MAVRKATEKDFDDIMRIYASAKKFMDAHDNPTQWVGYPSAELVQEDIRRGICHVYEDDGIHGVFVLILGEDPTYGYIENGQWLNDLPYGTIHRVASDGERRGVFSKCLAFSKEVIRNLRIDTHHDNYPMQQAIEREGFQRCGIIYVEDGSPRIAYQLPL